MKFLRKGFALFAGLMLLSNVFLPSAVVFASEEGTPLAATEQVNQVAQSEATASVEENSTLEVSPEKVVSESSEALPLETPKAEEGSETPAEKVNQEAKEEQKAEPASDLATSSEPKKAEPASELEEGRGETLTPAQQGGGDAGSSDVPVATPEDKQSIEEKKEAKKDRPSMIADRSDEGQPFVMEETTFRGKKALEDVVYFYSSSNTRKVAGILKKVGDYEVIDREATVQLAEKLGFSKEDVEAKLLLFSNDRIVEIDGKKVFFALEKKNAKKQKVTYVSEHNSNLKDAFKWWEPDRTKILDKVDLTKKIFAYGNTTSFLKKGDPGYRETADKYNKIKGSDDKLIGYTIKTDDDYWFYAPVKKDILVEPVKLVKFYGEDGKEVSIVEEEGQLSLVATKNTPDLPTCKYNLDCEKSVELLEIEWEKVLFGEYVGKTIVYFLAKDSKLKGLFSRIPKNLKKGDVTYDAEKIQKPSWVTDEDMKELAGYIELKEGDKIIGYGLKTKNEKRFYAPVKKEAPIVPSEPEIPLNKKAFYTSNNFPFEVVMKDEKTVDLEKTKALLTPRISEIPEDKMEGKTPLKVIAEKFAKEATEDDVEIKEIKGLKLLFVSLKFDSESHENVNTSTKVFFSESNSILTWAFKGGEVIRDYILWDESKIVAPKWIKDTSRDNVIAYNVIREKGRPIAYALKTKENHWFYAPIKKVLPSSDVFYTSNDKPFQFVVGEKGKIDLGATKSFYVDEVNLLPEGDDKNEALDFLNNGTEKDVEIKEIEGVKLLFVKTSRHTKVLRSPKEPMFKVAFTKGSDITADIVYHSPIKPSWATSEKIQKYNEVKKDGKLIGYTLKDADKHWFYASAAYRVNFEMNGATALADQILPLSNPKVSKPADPARSGYRFGGWYVDKEFKTVFDFTKPITAHTTIYAKWERISSGGGGWGGGSSSSSSSSSSSTSKPSTAPSTGEYTELVLSGEVTTPICSIANSTFAEEQNQAYTWACERDITTIRAIENARLNDPLTRAELAKMMSMYATKVLGKQIVITGEVKYADVDSSLGDLADYIKLAYQLQIMGIHADGKALEKFEPHALVSRAEFGTVLSRVLFGAQYNQDGAERYAKHLNALKEVKVLTNTTPTLQELRGWVMLMMMRTEKMLENLKK